MKLQNIFLLVILFLFSCKEKVHSQSGKDSTVLMQGEAATTRAIDTTYLDVNGKKYTALGTIPESLRTKEQSQLIALLNDVSVNAVSVKDNHMVLDLTKEQFVVKGIPSKYYDLLQQNIHDNNEYFDANGIKHVDKMMEDRREEYKKSMEAKQK